MLYFLCINNFLLGNRFICFATLLKSIIKNSKAAPCSQCNGHSANGCTYCGTDDLPGAHWTICLVDIYEKAISYGDSLTWLVPDVLFFKRIWVRC